jgi:small subunit ribosomal protein S6e
MALKIVIGTKSGKSYQKELEGSDAEALYGQILGNEVAGDGFGFSGASFLITGGSDDAGFPMRKDLPGQGRKSILMAKGTGFKGKLRGKRFGGLRIKKTVAGNTISKATNQVNLKVVKGDKVVEKAFAPAQEPDAPAEEKKEE